MEQRAPVSSGYPAHTAAVERVIRIRDLNEGIFLYLLDLLPVFEPEGHAWTWSLQVVPDVSAEEGWDFNLDALERQIEGDHRGLRMGFEDLIRFGGRVGQVVGGEFLAGESPSALPRRHDDAAAACRSAVAGLAAIDSTYWLLGGPTAIVERAVERFRDVDEVTPDDWIRGEG